MSAGCAISVVLSVTVQRLHTRACPFCSDYDNDGDSDLVFTMYNEHPKLYRNDAGVFVDVSSELVAAYPSDVTELTAASVRWADVDNDNWLDLIVLGGSYTGNDSRVMLFMNQVRRSATAALSFPLKYSPMWGHCANRAMGPPTDSPSRPSHAASFSHAKTRFGL